MTNLSIGSTLTNPNLPCRSSSRSAAETKQYRLLSYLSSLINHGAEVGAFGKAAADQAGELLDAALVGSPVSTGKKHAACPADLDGNADVVGKLFAVVQGERAKEGSGRTQHDQGVGHGVAAFIRQLQNTAETAFALPQDQQKAFRIVTFNQVAFLVSKLAALVGCSGAFADVASLGDRAASPAAGPAAGTATTPQMPVKRAASRSVGGDQGVTTALARTNDQKRDLPGGKAFTQQPREHWIASFVRLW